MPLSHFRRWNDLSSADTTKVTPIDGTTIAGYGLLKI